MRKGVGVRDYYGVLPSLDEEQALFFGYELLRLLDSPCHRPSVQQRNRIIEAYLPVAEKIAQHYAASYPHDSDYIDFRSIAYETLIRAVERHNFSHYTHFSAYARTCIHGTLRNALSKRNCSLPFSVISVDDSVLDICTDNHSSDHVYPFELFDSFRLLLGSRAKLLEDRFYGGQTLLEIGTTLGLSVSTVCKKLKETLDLVRQRQRLQRELKYYLEEIALSS